MANRGFWSRLPGPTSNTSTSHGRPGNTDASTPLPLPLSFIDTGYKGLDSLILPATPGLNAGRGERDHVNK
ncbi:hypothetical protein E2C01_094126 [Portunus trituberculatus]|uniref:Uncharacterized protein n=1 Tax=Portunus trituberculatus TaxID=210409 RepID=A0A5B7JW36_PORTR|nr:hypothetical protein [Portunus trituberculatus]